MQKTISILALFVSTFAFAHGGDMSFGGRSTDIVGGANNQTLVEGMLSCNAGGENTGGTCALAIKDAKSGQTYRIVGTNNSAMKLFQDGTRHVALEGYVNGGEIIAGNARAL